MALPKREAGVLCHISSLPNEYGIGTLGKEAYEFAKKLAANGIKNWQILPLVQTGYGDSPYQSVFCNSGNPYFIDLVRLKREGLLTKQELKAARLPAGKVDYGALYQSRYAVLRTAFSRFYLDDTDFHAFVKSGFAEDYAMFMTAKGVFGNRPFNEWDREIKYRDADALEKMRTDHHEEYLFWQFLQYEFYRQWKDLKTYANGLGVKIIGDIPLYVAYDSADVWAHPDLFKLDEDLNMTKVAGVPPDYFCETGQLWGNPIYDWDAHRAEEYAWWNRRLSCALETYDLVRIDHFRGLDRYYEVDAGAENAIDGAWRDGPKEALFSALTQKKRARIIAEDLGLMDDGVRSLLQRTGFPGMRVLLFAFDGSPENDYLPSNYIENCVCYTGTHDNDTVAGYVKSLSTEEYILFRSSVAAELERCGMKVRLGNRPKGYCRLFRRMALASNARLAVIPVQDILGLDNDSRMNLPGHNGGNWQFRLKKLPSAHAMKDVRRMIERYGR